MVCTRFTLVNTLVLTVELHGKRMVMYYYFHHGIIHFALQLLHGKPPLLFVVLLQQLSCWAKATPNSERIGFQTWSRMMQDHAESLGCHGLECTMPSPAMQMSWLGLMGPTVHIFWWLDIQLVETRQHQNILFGFPLSLPTSCDVSWVCAHVSPAVASPVPAHDGLVKMH